MIRDTRTVRRVCVTGLWQEIDGMASDMMGDTKLRERMASSICAHVRGDIVEQSGYASININVPGGEQSMRREGG